MNNTTLHYHPHVLETFDKAELVILSLMLASCIFGNMLVVTAINRTRKKNVPSNILLLNLSVCDMMTAICGILFTLMIYNIYYKSKYYPYGEVGCKILWPFTTYAHNCSVFTLAVIAFEKYLNISSINFRFTKKTSFVALAIIHVLAITVVIPYSINLKYVANEKVRYCYEEWGDRWHMKVYTMFLFIVQYVLPLTMMAISYILAWRKLYMHNNTVIKMSEEYERIMDWQGAQYTGKSSAETESRKNQCKNAIYDAKLLKGNSLIEENGIMPSKKTMANCSKEGTNPNNDRIEEILNTNKKRYSYQGNRKSRSQSTLLSILRITYKRKTSAICLYPEQNQLHNSIRAIKRFNKSPYLSQVSYDRHRQSVRTLKMFSVVVIVFACFALPNQISWLLNDFSHLPSIASNVFSILTYVSPVTNCWIYSSFHNGIRKEYMHAICCSCYQRRPGRGHYNIATSTSLYGKTHENLFRRRMSFFNQIFEDTQKSS